MKKKRERTIQKAKVLLVREKISLLTLDTSCLVAALDSSLLRLLWVKEAASQPV